MELLSTRNIQIKGSLKPTHECKLISNGKVILLQTMNEKHLITKLAYYTLDMMIQQSYTCLFE